MGAESQLVSLTHQDLRIAHEYLSIVPRTDLDRDLKEKSDRLRKVIIRLLGSEISWDTKASQSPSQIPESDFKLLEDIMERVDQIPALRPKIDNISDDEF